MISFLSHRIALFLRNNDIVDDETSQVCQYGFEIIISTLVGFFIVFLIGICCGELLLAILFYALFVGVRLSAGGYHASSHLKCKLLLCACCLSNLVHEYGYSYCGLAFCSGSYYYDSYISGYWAADC